MSMWCTFMKIPIDCAHCGALLTTVKICECGYTEMSNVWCDECEKDALNRDEPQGPFTAMLKIEYGDFLQLINMITRKTK